MVPLGIPGELGPDTDLFGALINAFPHPIFFKDAAFRYIGCNEPFATMLGRPRDQIIGSTVFDLSPPHLARIYDNADRKLFDEGTTQRYASSVRFGDGTNRRGMFFKSVYRDAPGNKLGIIGIFYALEFMLEVMDF